MRAGVRHGRDWRSRDLHGISLRRTARAGHEVMGLQIVGMGHQHMQLTLLYNFKSTALGYYNANNTLTSRCMVTIVHARL